MLEKNDIIELTPDGVASDGSGVAHADGMAVFIPFAIPGDVVETRIVKEAKNCLYGKVERIVLKSPDRIEPDCEVFGRCGGCAYREATYEAELRYKRDKAEAALRRIGGINVEVPAVIPCESAGRYRNKLMLPVGVDFDGNPRLGFYARRSHRIISCGDCKLHPEIFNRISRFTFGYLMSRGVPPYDEPVGRGLLRHIYIRQAAGSGEIMLCLVVNGDKIGCEKEFVAEINEKFPEVTSIILNVNRTEGNVILGSRCITLYGSDFIYGTLRGVDMRISPLSFCQVNSEQAEKLYDVAERFSGLTPETCLLDLYCGAGAVGLSMARAVKELIGVEITPEAVEDARYNAEASGITNAEFICADAAAAAEKLRTGGRNPDVIIIDPPRVGCAESLIYTVSEMKPKRVVYISCDVATQARDLKIFAGRGYKTERVQSVDMFPHTAHVENVALLTETEK